MTDTKEQLMQGLLNKQLSEYSAQEVDGFIVDAYLSLEASLRGQLHTADGRVVEPSMGDWGVMGQGGTCEACLAGALFVSKTGTLIPEDDQPKAYDCETGDSISVLQFMDGLRYLEEDSDDGESIATLLNTLGYVTIPAEEDNYGNHNYEEEVASKLKRFIDLNPRLTGRIEEQIRTTN